MNREDKAPDQATPDRHRSPVQPDPRDGAAEPGEIKLIKPLRVSDEDPGGDPYNRTGRFTRNN